MLNIERKVRVLQGYHHNDIPLEVITGSEPVVFKNLIGDWPIVQAGRAFDEDCVSYIRQFYSGQPVVLFQMSAENNGRFFYQDSFAELNFNAQRVDLDGVLDKILTAKNLASPDTFYVGSTTVDTCLPTLRDQNDINLGDRNPLVSIWISNRATVAAHFDAPDNLACCVAGSRRFTLFPIEQAENLYMGPLDFTPAGQVISTVDFANPDFEKFPKFKTALEHALVADLEPGDALYLPSMWWHHVESLSEFNVLVNYWWRDVPKYMEPGANLLHMAMLSLRDLPAREKKAWKVLFDYHIFNDDEHRYDHIPEAARGFLNPMDDVQARRLRSWLLNKLNR